MKRLFLRIISSKLIHVRLGVVELITSICKEQHVPFGVGLKRVEALLSGIRERRNNIWMKIHQRSLGKRVPIRNL